MTYEPWSPTKHAASASAFASNVSARARAGAGGAARVGSSWSMRSSSGARASPSAPPTRVVIPIGEALFVRGRSSTHLDAARGHHSA